MGLGFALMWSSAFTSARMIVADAPPLTALTLRFVISGVIGIALARMAGQGWRMSRPQWIAVAVFGAMQNAAYLGLYFVAMQWVPASAAAIVASTLPLVVALAGWALGEEHPGRLGIAGLAAGFAGAALILGTRVQGGIDAPGLLLCITGVIALAAATLAVRGASSGGNLLMAVGYQMFVGAAVLAPFALMLETPEVNWTPRLVAAFAYTTLVPGLAATWLWFALVGRIGAVRAAAYHFLNPVFGVAIAAVLLGEPLGPGDVAGTLVIAAGILAVQWSRAMRR
jgi:drug/metabolite transporter (DMT)-like permease